MLAFRQFGDKTLFYVGGLQIANMLQHIFRRDNDQFVVRTSQRTFLQLRNQLRGERRA